MWAGSSDVELLADDDDEADDGVVVVEEEEEEGRNFRRMIVRGARFVVAVVEA